MYLGGQASQRGYAMAAVLVAIALLSVVMMALLPAWRQQGIREKEAELAFRGEQYARAIYLFQTKNGGMNPPSFDVLVQGKYLRKKFKDPINNEDFLPLFVGQQPQTPGTAGGRSGAPTPGGGRSGPVAGGISQPGGGRGGPGPGGTGSIPGGSILGVQSKSTEASIRIYNGAGYYNQWRFMYRGRGRGNPQQQPGAPGRGGPGADRPGPTGPGRGGVPAPGRGGFGVPGGVPGPGGVPVPGGGRGPRGGGQG